MTTDRMCLGMWVMVGYYVFQSLDAEPEESELFEKKYYCFLSRYG